MPDNVYAHIVTYNSARFVARCIESLLAQREFEAGRNLAIAVTDNSSADESVETVRRFAPPVEIYQNSANLGFSGGHNLGATRFLQGKWKYLLILNPDVRLDSGALAEMVGTAEAAKNVAGVTPRLYRADQNLEPDPERRLDAAGMYITPALRHFDRGSGERDGPEYDRPCAVFGGTGAALLLTRAFVEDALLPARPPGSPLFTIYPQLAVPTSRAQLFDEAFFAYREDADLAWRAQLLGWSFLYAPKAVGYHTRVVLPSNRSELPAELNRFGVRNRFLLQLNNFSARHNLSALAQGVIFRNAAVVAGVVLRERSSLPALREVASLRKDAWEQRRQLFLKARERDPDALRRAARWFHPRPYVEYR